MARMLLAMTSELRHALDFWAAADASAPSLNSISVWIGKMKIARMLENWKTKR